MVELPVIWDTMALMRRDCNAVGVYECFVIDWEHDLTSMRLAE